MTKIQYVVSGTLNSVKMNLSVRAGCQTVEHRHCFDMKSNISDIYRLTFVVASQPTYRPTPTYCICNKLLTAQLIYQSGSNRHWRFFSHITLQINSKQVLCVVIKIQQTFCIISSRLIFHFSNQGIKRKEAQTVHRLNYDTGF